MNKNIFIKIISRIKKIFFANSMPCEKPYMEENMEQSNLLLILNLTRREKSKDSSRALTKLTIKNREIDYSLMDKTQICSLCQIQYPAV